MSHFSAPQLQSRHASMHLTFHTQSFRIVICVVFLRQCWDPMWADITMLIVGHICFQLLPIIQPAALHWYPPCIQRHCAKTIHCEVNIPLLRQPHLAPLNGLAVP